MEGLRAIGMLPKLEMLSLFGTAITDEGLRHLHSLLQFRLLVVGETQVTKKGKAALKRACRELKMIDRGGIYSIWAYRCGNQGKVEPNVAADWFGLNSSPAWIRPPMPNQQLNFAFGGSEAELLSTTGRMR